MARLRGVLACLVALSVWGGVSFDARAGFPPTGFAIWPEDNEAAAAAACANRGEEEVWRTDQGETAREFVGQELGWNSPVFYSDPDEESPSRLVIGDEEGKGVFLGIVLELFRYDDCWYISQVFMREGGLGVESGFTEVDGQTNLLLKISNYTPPRLFADAGFGDENDITVEPGEQLLIPVEDETTTGHYFVYEEEQPGEWIEGVSLPAPMDPSTAEPASTKDGYTLWPFHHRGPSGDRKGCRPSNSSLHDPEESVRRFVHDGLNSKVNRLERVDRRHWTVRAERARLSVTLRRVLEDCWPVRKVSSFDRTIDPTLRVEDVRYTAEFEWGDAASVNGYVAYGGVEQGFFISTVEGPFTEPAALRFERTGGFFVALYDSEGRLVGAEGSALGPITGS